MSIVNDCDRREHGIQRPWLEEADIAKLKVLLNSDNANLHISEDTSLLHWVLLWRNEELFKCLQNLGAV